MNEYLDKFKYIFKKIINEYGFEISHSSNARIILKKDNFVLIFTPWRECVSLFYGILLPNDEVRIDDIRNYVSEKITNEDRSGIRFDDAKTIYERNLLEFQCLANTLSNHFPELLNGGQVWREDYKKSFYYDEPMIRPGSDYFT